jgi:hypothetical protein
MGIKNLPLDSGKKIKDVFVESFGWICHYGKNHWVMTHPNKPPELVISIPDHREVDRKLLMAELRKAGIDEKDFCRAYRGR